MEKDCNLIHLTKNRVVPPQKACFCIIPAFTGEVFSAGLDKGMVKNRHLSGSISDAGWSRFVSMLTYKADWYSRTAFKVNRFYPSSKKCSVPGCGYIYKELKLSEREWVCPQCGKLHDRDENAGDNLFLESLEQGKSGTIRTGTQVPTPEECAPTDGQSIVRSRRTLRREIKISIFQDANSIPEVLFVRAE